MLSDALRVEVLIAVLQVDPLLEKATLLQVVVESQDFDPIWCLSVPLNRRLELVFIGELADRRVVRV